MSYDENVIVRDVLRDFEKFKLYLIEEMDKLDDIRLTMGDKIRELEVIMSNLEDYTVP